MRSLILAGIRNDASCLADPQTSASPRRLNQTTKSCHSGSVAQGSAHDSWTGCQRPGDFMEFDVMYSTTSVAAYGALHTSKKHVWSVPAPNAFPEQVEPPFGGARIFSGEVCRELQFTPRFQLPRNARIFTIGSCFARNVEEALLQQGFNVMTRQGEFPYAHGYLNRYNTAAMAQEMDFAIGDRIFDERSIAALDVDGYADLTSYGIFNTPADAMELRRWTTRLFKGLLSADFIIITAGLSEVWYDKDYDYYTNIAPSRAALVYPDRFEFRLLSYADNFQELRRLIDKIRTIRPTSNIVLTVSPVPLNAT